MPLTIPSINQIAHVNHTSLSYSTLGQSGSTLLVMHGGLGFDSSYLRPWLDAINPTGTLVFYDHRGNGASAMSADWSTITHATWVEDADALRVALGHDRVIPFGHSYGGFLALEYALRFPENVEGLILCSTAPALTHGAQIVDNARKRATAKQFARVMEMLSGPLRDDETLANGMREIMPLYFHDPLSPNADKIASEMTFRSAAFNRAFFECAPNYNVTARLGELRVPTLIVGGADDWIIPFEVGPQVLAQHIADAALIEFAQSGHFPFIEEHEKFVIEVNRWIRKHAATRVQGSQTPLPEPMS